VNAVVADLQALMAANPTLFGGLTGIHADTVVRQLQLENTYIAQPQLSRCGKGQQDIFLDIIDIHPGRYQSGEMAKPGWRFRLYTFRGRTYPTPRYQDNDAQTNFWGKLSLLMATLWASRRNNS